MIPLGHGDAEAGTVAGAGTDEGHRMERIDQYQFPGAMTSHQFKHASAISRRDLPEFCKNCFASPKNRGRGECRVLDAPADGVTGSPGAFQASRASYGAVCGARRAACLEGRRSSLTLMV